MSFSANFADAEQPEKAAKIAISPECQTFYADREQTFILKATDCVGKLLSWNMRYAGRTLASGESAVPQSGEVKIKIKFPKLNEGVAAAIKFTVFIGKEVEREKDLFLFYPNPFAGSKKTFEEMNIGVWEAGGGKGLSALLKKVDLPFVEVADPVNFAGNVLLVSGLDFDENPGISETLADLAEKGKKVVIIPPISGSFANFAKKSNAVILRKNDRIKEFNKKFDTKNWNGAEIGEKTLRISQIDDTPSLKFVEKSEGFTFVEIRYEKGLDPGGEKKIHKTTQSVNYKMILITWKILKAAEKSPTPLYLLKNIIGGRKNE
jgi:hypothetical protein